MQQYIVEKNALLTKKKKKKHTNITPTLTSILCL